MARIKFYLFLFLIPAFVAPAVSRAQQTQIYTDPDAQYRNALDLFEKQKYEEAQVVFDNIVSTAKDKNSLLAIDGEYYGAMCAYELFHKDAEIRLEQFLTDHPESPKCERVIFQLGRYYYRKKDFKNAIAWFHQADIYDLQKEEQDEFYFKRGYSFFMLGENDSAKTDFAGIKDGDSKYATAATYYYSHIAYAEGNYETALQGFLKISGDETFGPVVPYYIAQIYFFQKRYTDVISYAPPLLDSAKRAPEIAHLIGASYYRLDKFSEAIPFLEKYLKGAGAISREDNYELAYAYYKSGKENDAENYFQQAIADSSDALAQNAWYYLADCYLKTGDKLSARNAFGKASAMKFDPVIREDALFSYARLSYELSFSPFNEAIVALTEYLDEYPATPRHDEAYTLLTNVYLSSNNYQKALDAIEKIKNLSPVMQPAYQQIAFNLASTQLNNGDYDDALKNFDKSLTYPISREMNAQAHYRKGETFYKKAVAKKDSSLYTKAIAEYRVFLVTPGAPVQPNYNTANYDIGYCYFQQALICNNNHDDAGMKNNFNTSMLSFRKYIANMSANDNDSRVCDACIRMGDGYFRVHDFINSAEFYGKAVAMQKGEYKDYALFQQAMAAGYEGKKDQKAALLKQLRTDYPKSNYYWQSRYQEARTLHDLRQYDDALAAYNEIYNHDSKGKLALECLQDMGLIYLAKNDPDNALAMYKKAVPLATGDDYKSLMHNIKNIYISRGKLDDWENYASSVGFSESAAVADSTTYGVAANFFNAGNCSDAMKQITKYIQKFPTGIYITDVQYMRAECSFKNNDMTTALAAYNAVLDKGHSPYTEHCLVQAATIYYRQGDYSNAARLYSQLQNESSNTAVQNDAHVNIMRCYLSLGNTDSAEVYAAKVLTIPHLPDDIKGQATYLMAKASLTAGDKVNADKQFKDVEKLIPHSVYAAEARYEECYIIYDNKKYKDAQKALLKQINDYAGFSQWSGRGWLLLADADLALKDTFQAKYVLQNYIDNGDVPDLVQQAKDKLQAINAAQKGATGKKQEDIILPGSNNRLYDNSDTLKTGGNGQ